MNDSKPLLSVGLYVLGEELNPAEITAVLGVSPTKSQRKGEWKETTVGRRYATKSGLWVLQEQRPNHSLDSLVLLLSRQLPLDTRISELPGAESAFLDIYVGMEADDEGSADVSMDLSPESLKLLSGLGLPLRLSVTSCQD